MCFFGFEFQESFFYFLEFSYIPFRTLFQVLLRPTINKTKKFFKNQAQ